MKVPYRGKMLEATALEFEAVKEGWNEYKASDGTILRVKVVVTNIAKVNELDEAGNPIYVVKSSNVLSVLPQ